MYVTIDPLNAGCTAKLTDITPTPIYTGVNAACFTTAREDELMLANGGSFRSHSASFLLSKDFDGGMFTDNGSAYFSLGYAFSDSQDRRNMYNSTAGSNYDLTAAFDRQDPQESRGFFSSKHNISTQLNFSEEFFGDYASRLGITFIARSGRPYSLTFTGGGEFNDSQSGFENAMYAATISAMVPKMPVSTVPENCDASSVPISRSVGAKPGTEAGTQCTKMPSLASAHHAGTCRCRRASRGSSPISERPGRPPPWPPRPGPRAGASVRCRRAG
jgi:hypothetical protein